MSSNNPEDIQKEIRVYYIIFGTLAVLTAVTVGVSYADLKGAMAIGVALLIASVKGFLVAGYFMHLLSEKKLVYAILALTVVLFGILMWIPFSESY